MASCHHQGEDSPCQLIIDLRKPDVTALPAPWTRSGHSRSRAWPTDRASAQLSPVELVKACLSRIGSYDGQVNAFITVTAEQASKQAREAEREIAAGRYRGPLHGIPFGLKDVIETAGIRTTAHSRLLENNVPPRDAAVVEKLYRAGAILIGKLSTHEFAHGGPSFDLPWPPARNPWDLARFTGGSSSGSGAAVAARFIPAALGYRYRRIGPHTRGAMRRHRPETDLRPREPTRDHPQLLQLRSLRPDRTDGRRLRALLQAIAGYDRRGPR